MSEKTYNLKVTDMTCDGCVATVKKTLNEIQGVDRVSVDLESGATEVTVTDPSITSDQLIRAIKLAGYNAQLNS